jgi:hypothetical protein
LTWLVGGGGGCRTSFMTRDAIFLTGLSSPSPFWCLFVLGREHGPWAGLTKTGFAVHQLRLDRRHLRPERLLDCVRVPEGHCVFQRQDTLGPFGLDACDKRTSENGEGCIKLDGPRSRGSERIAPKYNHKYRGRPLRRRSRDTSQNTTCVQASRRRVYRREWGRAGGSSEKTAFS